MFNTKQDKAAEEKRGRKKADVGRALRLDNKVKLSYMLSLK